MIAYFDASAFLKLVIAEPGSADARAAWDDAQTRISSRLLYPEARAGLARARRMHRLDAPSARAARYGIDDFLDEAELIGVTAELARRAGDLAEEHGLRAYDAVHLASAEEIGDAATVFVAADGQLLAAAAERGLNTLSLPH